MASAITQSISVNLVPKSVMCHLAKAHNLSFSNSTSKSKHVFELFFFY